jgi:hypothetical protein
MLRPLLLIAASCLTVSAFAFHPKPSGASVTVPEGSQQSLASQQQLQGVVKSSNGARIEVTEPIKFHASDPKAANLVASSVIASAATSEAPLKQPSGEPITSATGPMGALILGFGAFFAFWIVGKRSKP